MDGETIFFSVSVGCAERAFRPFSLRSSLFSNNIVPMLFSYLNRG